MTATSEPGISQPTVLFQAFMSMQSVQDRSFPRTCTWARVLLDMSYIQCYFYRSKTNYVLSKVSYQMIHFAIKNYTGRTRTQSLWCPRARLTLKAEVRTLSNIRGTRLSHHEKGPSVRTWPGKTPIAWKENVFAWLRLCANQALCHYQECASDRQRAMSLVWLLHGDCNGPFLLFGVWLAKMDFVHLPVRLSARGSVWIESPSRTLKGSGGARGAGGGLRAWNPLDRAEAGWRHNNIYVCPAAHRLLPCQGRTKPREDEGTCVHPLYLRDANFCLLGRFFKRNK